MSVLPTDAAASPVRKGMVEHMAKLFGTDGVRDIAGVKLTCEFAMRIGQAAALALTQPHGGARSKVVIGKDTRASSDMLEQAVSAGLTAMGVDVVLLGVIPTPAVAWLCAKYEADAGIVISASHNPYEHNGIKIFGKGGRKLTDAQQEAIEALLSQSEGFPAGKSGNEIGRVYYLSTAAQEYVEHLAGVAQGYFPDFKVVVDAANGAASTTVGLLAKRLAIPMVIINDQPDGVNINDNCGSTAPEALCRAVVANRARLGIALDGDADRVVAVDEKGEVVDGDKLIAVFASYLKEKGRLTQDKVAVTVMSNLGLVQYLKELGIDCVQTAVGDRNVLEAMERENLALGGEQSGHLILREYAATGDGQLAMVFLLSILYEKQMFLSRMASRMERFPQVVVNVRVSEQTKKTFAQNETFLACKQEMEEALEQKGRILIRPSGTEPVLRVMVEGSCMETVNQYAVRLAQVLADIDRGEQEGQEEE